MRGQDWDLAIALRDHWLGVDTPLDAKLCPLLADLDGLLAYLDEQGITPGDALLPCPVCGDHHRWALLRKLMEHALDIQPARHSKLLAMVNRSLDVVRDLYGGEEGYQRYKQGAEEFFAKVDAGQKYTVR